MNRNNYYFVKSIRREKNVITGQLGFRPEHPVFKGHFPGQPVVPGVCMLEIVKAVLQEQLNQPLILARASRVKFLQALVPDPDPLIDLDIRYEQQDGSVQVVAQFLKQDLPLFKFQGQYRPSLASGAPDLANK